MLVTSLDIETTALDPSKGDILEVGVMQFDLEKLKVTYSVEHKVKVTRWDHETLRFHHKNGALDRHFTTDDRISPSQLPYLLEKITLDKNMFLVGANLAGFDIPWLKSVGVEFAQYRYFDIANLYVKPGDKLKSLEKTIDDNQIPVAPKSLHTSLYDATMALKLFLKWYGVPDAVWRQI